MSVLVVAVLYLGHAAIFGDYIADDAGISLAYARNLAAGFGPVLYAGGEAVEGFSNPLWTAIITLGVLLRLDVSDGIPMLKALGLLFGAGTLWLTARVARRAYPTDTPNLRWFAPAILAVWTPFVFWSGAGLENPLYVFLLLLAMLLQFREIEDVRARPWSALALAGVALTRPEGCAFFIAFLVHRVIVGRERWRLLAWAAIFVSICAVFLAARVYVFGDWLPNTYHAKIAEREITGLWRYLFTSGDPGSDYLQLFAVTNLLLLAVAAIGLGDLRYWRVGLLMVAVGSGTAVYALYVGGDFWPEFRFLTPALPMLAIPAQHALSLLPLRTAALQQVAAIMVAGVVIYGSVSPSLHLRQRHRQDQLISLQGRLDQGRRMRALATALGIKDPLYLDPDIGGPSVVGLRVLDLGGLTDVHIARFQWYPTFFRDYIFKEKRPDIIRTHSTWTKTSQVTAYPEFHEQYVAVHSSEDTLGLHGEFIRRDLLKRTAPAAAARTEPASFRQAVADRRARQLREDRREADGWIEYYADRGWYEELLATFRRREASSTLPDDPARLRDLYYALLAAGERPGADRVRHLAGMPSPEGRTFAEGGTPVLSLIAHRVLQRELHWASLQISFDVLQTPGADYTLRIDVSRTSGGKVERLTRNASPAVPTSSWKQGAVKTFEVPLYFGPGVYEISAVLIGPGGGSPMCETGNAAVCTVSFGTHHLTR
jgi:hypothetical protein